MDPSLLDYARQAKAAGSTRKDVYDALIGAGWNATDTNMAVDAAFGAAQQNFAKPDQTPAAAPVQSAAPAQAAQAAPPTLDLKNWKQYYEFPSRRLGQILFFGPIALLVAAAVISAASSLTAAPAPGLGWLDASPALAATAPISGDSALNYSTTISFGTKPAATGGMTALAGLLALLSILSAVLTPVGLVLMGKRRVKPGVAYDTRSGNGADSTVPPEISGWSWGAAGLGMTWGLYHHAWLTLLQLITPLNLIWWIVMGIKGKEWAWRSQPWLSVEHFNRVQKTWNSWGVFAFFFVLIGPLVAVAVAFPALMAMLAAAK